jgi:hypothetical protein
MKTLATLNTKRVDVFLRFPMNIYVSPADKPSNGYGHWKTTRVKFLVGIWKQIEFSKTEEDCGWTTIKKLKEKEDTS